ncbi:MAG: ribonuclease P protein component [Patescibacteria group bacterium]|nr:ribonuclease P protein component [Patescibacteria group bacterium]
MRQQDGTKVIHSPAFTVRFRSLASARVKNPIKFVVSTKISKKAVDRNKIRRRLKEIWKKFQLPQNSETIIYAKKEVLNLSFSEINELSKSAVKKLMV